MIEISKQDLIDYYSIMGLSSNQIGEIYDCSNQIVLRRLHKYNIPIRTKSEIFKGNKINLGRKLSEEHKLKISNTLTGRKLTEEHKKNISEGKKGRSSTQQNENHPQWKGDNASYYAIHIWVNNHKSKPDFCDICGENKILELSNKDHKYRRNIEDYQYLCRKCHGKFDRDNNLRKHKKVTKNKKRKK